MRKYDNEFKQNAVKKILDGQSVASVSRELGVAEGVLHNWKKVKLASSSDGEQEVLELKKRLREVEMERDILKKGGTYLREGKLKRYEFIEAESSTYPIKIICRVMEVTRSGYYAYLKRKVQPKTGRELLQAGQVKECFLFHRRRYGSRRIAAEPEIGRYLTRRLMREQDLKAIQPKSFVPKTTNSGHGGRISPNLLKQNKVEIFEKGRMIVGDITYLPLKSGKFCYLATFQDKYTRRIVGWAIMTEMTAELVVRALEMGLRRGLIAKNAIVHTDRGSQYVSNLYRELLHRHGGLRQSMSGKGNCYDNAQAESFFARFKTELVEDGVFESVEQAISETFSYIEGYYNRIRLHSGLGYKSPLEFEKELKIKNETRSVSFVSYFT